MTKKSRTHKMTNQYVFSDEEKRILRPIAETYAMMDGNAFFGMELGDGRKWYEQYLPEAKKLFDSNGGYDSLKDRVSWLIDQNHENLTVEDAYNQWRIVKELSK